MLPRNDADALHGLLEVFTEPDKIRLDRRWAEVLECDWKTPEFARRHGEVVGLLTGSLGLIALLPPKAAERFERYAWRWWYAVVATSHAWPNEVDTKSVITHEALDQLGSAAELIASHLGGSSASPRSESLDSLAEQCAEWISALESDTDLPAALRLDLLHDLRHVMWLIEHADLFGVGQAASAAQRVVGGIAVASVHVRPSNKAAWTDRAQGLCGVLLQLTGLFAATDAAVEASANLGRTVMELATSDPSPQPAEDDVVDAEIVDDD